MPVSKAEAEVIFSGPSVACNKFYLTITEGVGRLTFCETAKIDDDLTKLRFCAAVSIPLSGLAPLAKLINDMLGKNAQKH